MQALDGSNLTTMESSFMLATGMEIVAGLNTIITGTTTTTGIKTATTTTIDRNARP
jgi:hypothetical protein